MQPPISETNPRQFFDLLSSRLEEVIAQQHQMDRPPKQKSLSNSNIPLLLAGESDGDGEPVALARDMIESNNKFSHVLFIKSNNIESMDAQLEKHIELIDRNHHNQKLNDVGCKSSPKMTSKTSNTIVPKMRDLSLNSGSQYSHSTSHSMHSSGYNQTGPIVRSNLNEKLFNTDKSHKSTGVVKKTNDSHHHFYQLTSTSKEVDIDSQGGVNNQHHPENKDSRRKSNAFERVSDWLSHNKSSSQPAHNKEHIKAQETSIKKIDTQEHSSPIQVAYYLPNEESPYLSNYTGKTMTLKQFKDFIVKKGNFKYVILNSINLNPISYNY